MNAVAVRENVCFPAGAAGTGTLSKVENLETFSGNVLVIVVDQVPVLVCLNLGSPALRSTIQNLNLELWPCSQKQVYACILDTDSE